MSETVKLTFYYLDEHSGKPVFRIDEREAIEVGTTYLPVTKFPRTPIVHKVFLGLLQGHDANKIVVLKEPNLEYVKQKFKEYFEKEVKHHKRMVDIWEDRIACVTAAKEGESDEA